VRARRVEARALRVVVVVVVVGRREAQGERERAAPGVAGGRESAGEPGAVGGGWGGRISASAWWCG
jgi:hypothetical protein